MDWMWLVVYSALLVPGCGLAWYADRIPTRAVGFAAIVTGIGIFAARLTNEGPYVLPQRMDLISSALAVTFGTTLAWRRSPRGDSSPGALTRGLLVVSPIVFLMGLAAVAHELEEVVEVRSVDSDGGVMDRRYWVVDYDGAPWIFTGRTTDTVVRVAAHPQVEFVRGGAARCAIATPSRDPQVIDEVFRLRGEKYLFHRIMVGVGERLFELNLHEGAAAVRFDSCAAGQFLPAVAAPPAS